MYDAAETVAQGSVDTLSIVEEAGKNFDSKVPGNVKFRINSAMEKLAEAKKEFKILQDVIFEEYGYGK